MSKEKETPKAQAVATKKCLPNTIRIVAIIVLIAVLICAVPVTVLGVRNARLRERASFIYNGELQQECLFPIDLNEADQAYRVKQTHRYGQTSKFDYFCEPSLELGNASEYGTIIFANVSTNDCILVLTIMDADGELMYRSGGVEPGKYITRIRLLQGRSPGTYPCRAYVTAFDGTSGELIGVQYSPLTVNIGG